MIKSEKPREIKVLQYVFAYFAFASLMEIPTAHMIPAFEKGLVYWYMHGLGFFILFMVSFWGVFSVKQWAWKVSLLSINTALLMSIAGISIKLIKSGFNFNEPHMAGFLMKSINVVIFTGLLKYLLSPNIKQYFEIN